MNERIIFEAIQVKNFKEMKKIQYREFTLFENYYLNSLIKTVNASRQNQMTENSSYTFYDSGFNPEL